MNIKTMLRMGRERLHGCGIRFPKADSELLLASVLVCDRSHLITHEEDTMSQGQEQAFLAAIEKRCTGMPIQYIRGRQEFWGRDFLVNPEVLIPRPESELLVEHAIRIARSGNRAGLLEQMAIADVATGSGCLAVSLALELPAARVLATDISEGAIDIARRNAEKHQVRDRLVFLVGDLGYPLIEKYGLGHFDMMVCNLPYGALGQMEIFDREVIAFEPHRALFGGQSGTEIMERFVPQAKMLLKPQGYLFMEIGIGQSESVSAMLKEGWEAVECYADLQGIPRCVVARRCFNRKSAGSR
jgi:release factor glutamine methyltransferase